MFIRLYVLYIQVAAMGKVKTVTVRVSEELKRKMERVEMNWSEYIRGAIQKKVEERRRRVASLNLDEVRKRVEPVDTEELVSWIREDRER